MEVINTSVPAMIAPNQPTLVPENQTVDNSTAPPPKPARSAVLNASVPPPKPARSFVANVPLPEPRPIRAAAPAPPTAAVTAPAPGTTVMLPRPQDAERSANASAPTADEGAESEAPASAYVAPPVPLPRDPKRINMNPIAEDMDQVSDLRSLVARVVHKDGSKNIGDCINNSPSFNARRASLILQDDMDYISIADTAAAPEAEDRTAEAAAAVAPVTELLQAPAEPDAEPHAEPDAEPELPTELGKRTAMEVEASAAAETALEPAPEPEPAAMEVEAPAADDEAAISKGPAETQATVINEQPPTELAKELVQEQPPTDMAEELVHEQPPTDMVVEVAPVPDEPKARPKVVIKSGDHISIKFTHILRELAETERTYRNDLSDIIEGYQKFLVHTLDEADLEMIFGNIEELWEFHKELGDRIDHYCGECPERIGEVFSEMGIKRFMVYEKYYIDHMKSLSFLFQKQEDSEFLSLLVKCQTNIGHQLPLADYLLKPVQRLLKYPLLFNEMIKACGDVAGFESLHAGSQVLKEVADNINEIKRKLDVSKYVESLQKRLLNWDGPDLASFGGLKDAGFFKVSASSHKNKTSQRQVLLFELGILICKPRAGGFVSVKHFFKMDDLYLQTMLNEALSFRLTLAHNKKVYFTFYCKNQEDKQYWIAKIKKVIIDFHTQGRKPLPPPAAIKPKLARKPKMPSSDRDRRGRDSGTNQDSPVTRRKFDFLQRRTTGRKRFSTVEDNFKAEKAPVNKKAPEDQRLMYNPFASAGGFDAEEDNAENKISHSVDIPKRNSSSIKTKRNRNSVAIVVDDEADNKRTSTLSTMSTSSSNSTERTRLTETAEEDEEAALAAEVAEAAEIAKKAAAKQAAVNKIAASKKASADKKAASEKAATEKKAAKRAGKRPAKAEAVIEAPSTTAAPTAPPTDEGCQACVVRCNFPDLTHTSVIVKAGDSMKKAFSSRLARRGLRLSECIIQVPNDPMTKIGWADDALNALKGKIEINVTKIKGSSQQLRNNSRLVIRVPSGNLIVNHPSLSGVMSTPDKLSKSTRDSLNASLMNPAMQSDAEPEAIVITADDIVPALDDDGISAVTAETISTVDSLEVNGAGEGAAVIVPVEAAEAAVAAAVAANASVPVPPSTANPTRSKNTNLYLGAPNGPKPKFPARVAKDFSVKRAPPAYPRAVPSHPAVATAATAATVTGTVTGTVSGTVSGTDIVVEQKVSDFNEMNAQKDTPVKSTAVTVDLADESAEPKQVNRLARRFSSKCKEPQDEVDHAAIRYRNKQPPATAKHTSSIEAAATATEGGLSPAAKRARVAGPKPVVASRRPTSVYTLDQPNLVPRRPDALKPTGRSGPAANTRGGSARQSGKGKATLQRGGSGVDVAEVRLRRDTRAENVEVKRWDSSTARTSQHRSSQGSHKRNSNRSSMQDDKHLSSYRNSQASNDGRDITSPTKRHRSSGHDDATITCAAIPTRSSGGGFRTTRQTGPGSFAPPPTSSFGTSNLPSDGGGGHGRFSVKHKIAQFGGGSTPETNRKKMRKKVKKVKQSDHKTPRHTDV